jgi:hypothetical protein
MENKSPPPAPEDPALSEHDPERRQALAINRYLIEKVTNGRELG